ncbi:MAG: intradiol ring-cleavage dioxygenase, partial [Chitinophagaceae bacterium]
SQKLPANPADTPTGGRCEGCEALHESPVALDHLPSFDTLPEFNDGGEKIHISGTVFKADGRTPAPGVVLYVYHTNAAGIYPTKGNETGWEKQHGYIRGWIKTDQNGAYGFYTTSGI